MNPHEKTITFQELAAFINSQPDEREINMSSNMGCEVCGCILVHFTKENIPENILNKTPSWGCGYDSSGGSIYPDGTNVETVFHLEFDVADDYITTCASFAKRVHNYKQAKEILKNYNPLGQRLN